MTILDNIVAHKRIEVVKRQALIGIDELEASIAIDEVIPSMSKFIADPLFSGIIAEYKRRSPSLGIINAVSEVTDVVLGYQKAGVSAISVLTDLEFFGGTAQDLVEAREATTIPIIRKDFVISEYQIIEARAIGASAILLIAAILDKTEIARYAKLATSLGMEVLFEVHTHDELDKVTDNISMIGVNNRDLKSFKVDIERSIEIASMIPENVVKVAESGISNVETVWKMQKAGFKGFLMGENFMKTEDPALACAQFIKDLKR